MIPFEIIVKHRPNDHVMYLISFLDSCHTMSHLKKFSFVGWRLHPSKQDHFVVEQSWRHY